MIITQITEQEQRLTHTLRTTTEALLAVTAERDAQRRVLEQALEALWTSANPKAEAAITAIQEQLKS